MNEHWDSLWTNARLATMTAGGAAYRAIERGALAVGGGRLAWAGPMAERGGSSAAAAHEAGGAGRAPELPALPSPMVPRGRAAAATRAWCSRLGVMSTVSGQSGMPVQLSWWPGTILRGRSSSASRPTNCSTDP